MSEPVEEDLETVARLFLGMGAEQSQAEVMAKQLLKRAAQLSAERGISKVEAAAILLKQVAEAREGLAPRINTEVKSKDSPKS
ncbi:MAG: hypothetical protein GWO81_04520 [Verrucomicrobia bacterium]|nr:hypothetical protein [Verrucomicrobiota bacterium]